MVVNLTNMLSRYRWWVIILSIVLAAMAGLGAKNFTIANDYRVYFDDDFPPLLDVYDIEDTYTKNENVLIVITAKNGDVFTQKNLAAVEWLTNESWSIPYSSRVDSLSNFQHTYAEEDDLIVEDLVSDAEQLTNERIEAIRVIANAEPRLADYLISKDKPVTGINITINLPGEDRVSEVEEIVDFTNDLKARAQARFPDLEIRLSGLIIMNSYFSTVARDDTSVIMPILFTAVILGLWFLLKSFAATLATTMIIVLSIVTAMGLAGWAGVKLTPPSMAASLMILTLAVAHCVHILVTYLNELSHIDKPKLDRKDRTAAVSESMRLNFSPIAITSITTLLGFLSMNFSDSPPFRDLGNIVAVGVFFSWMFSIFTLPALTQVMRFRPRKANQRTGKRMERLADYVINNRRWLTYVMLLFVVGVSMFAANNEIDDTYAHYFDETVEFRQAADYTDQNLTGIFPVNFSIETNEEQGVNDPKVLAFVERFSDWLRLQPEIGFVSTLTDTIKQLNQNMNQGNPDFYRLPEDKSLVAQYLLMYEFSLPYGLDLTNQINIDKSATRIFANMHISPSTQVLKFKHRSEAWLAENTIEGVTVNVGAPPYMFARMGQVNSRSMLISSGLALFGISIILIGALRSFKIGLISLVPNIVPAVMAFGVWGMFVGQVGLSLSMVLGMTMGIVVDDTVHLLSKYLRARREQGLSPEDSLRYAFSTVGTALWVTSIVLIVGFSAFILAHFEPNSSMGIMTAITIALALAADFLFLPVLILIIDKDRTDAPEKEEAMAAI